MCWCAVKKLLIHSLQKKIAQTSLYHINLTVQCKHTHTHPFNGPLSGTTRVSWYQRGKTNLDFTEARGNEWQWHQLGYMQLCTSLQTDNHASTPPLSFYRPDALPAAQPTASKHWRLFNIKLTGFHENVHIVQGFCSCQIFFVNQSFYAQNCCCQHFSWQYYYDNCVENYAILVILALLLSEMICK